MITVGSVQAEHLSALVLSEAERTALIRLFYVVKDNFWLDDLEESLLEQLLDSPAPLISGP